MSAKSTYDKHFDKARRLWIVTWRGREFGSARTRSGAEAIIVQWINHYFQYPERTIELLLKATA